MVRCLQTPGRLALHACALRAAIQRPECKCCIIREEMSSLITVDSNVCRVCGAKTKKVPYCANHVKYKNRFGG